MQISELCPAESVYAGGLALVSIDLFLHLSGLHGSDSEVLVGVEEEVGCLTFV